MTIGRRGSGRLRLYAVAPPGTGPLVQRELTALGVRDSVADAGGVAFTGSTAELFRTSLHLRCATRVLLRVASFRATAFHELQRFSERVEWERYLGGGAPARLRVTCRKSRLYHSDAVAERVAGSIAKRGGREVVFDAAPDPDSDEPVPGGDGGSEDGGLDEGGSGQRWRAAQVGDRPEQLVVVRLNRDRCSISICSSGHPLYMRGYRGAAGKAPLRENLAAALIAFSGWDGTVPLLDPMCGGGTIPIEGALMARYIPPGLARRERTPRSYAFEEWDLFASDDWGREVERARVQILPDGSSPPILAFDRSFGGASAARANAARAGVDGDALVAVTALSSVNAVGQRGHLIFNPPWGRRVGDEESLRNLYAQIGKLMRGRYASWQVTMLSGNPILERQLGVHPDQVLHTVSGGVKVRMLRFRRAVDLAP